MATNNVYEIVTNKIIELLDKGVVPWNRPWTYKAGNNGGFCQMNLKTKKLYRGINPWLLLATAEEKGYTSPYWLSFKQAKDMGGNVKAGEKSTMVIFWKFLSKEIKNSDGTIKNKTIPMLRYYSVFNLEQCEGIEAPKSTVETPAVSPDLTPIEACEQIMALYKTCPSISYGSNKAYYSPMPDTITMPDKDQFTSMEKYYSVLFHEAAHSTGHESRLHRSNFLSFFGSENYGKEELVAEMTAAFLCATAGIENTTIENSAAYVASWKETIKADSKMVVMAAAQAQKAADYMLGISHEEHKADLSLAE
jgi:antirestriction protein ArdC